MNIKEEVANFKTKYKEGFTQSDIDEILKNYECINLKKFYSILNGSTCVMVDGFLITYACDIEQGLYYGLE